MISLRFSLTLLLSIVFFQHYLHAQGVTEIGDIFFGVDGLIDLSLPAPFKHRASEVSVDASSFNIISSTVDSVQEAFDSIDVQQGALGVEHVDGFHSNGIFKAINSGTVFNASQRLLGPTTGATYTEGTTVITIPGVASFATLGIKSGDILEIVSPSVLIKIPE